MIKIFKSIQTAHKLKDGRLNIKDYGHYWVYNPNEDHAWMEYSKARFYISCFPWLEKFLTKINYI